ncbi:MAG TPA: ABC transporter permease [Acidimicrobiales bacterium]|nr:ABC transporter permease [Acidimicrobiales bacterium]
MLALREIRRSLVRFGLLVAAIALLVFLILFQQALRDGLITSFVGGIRNQSAPVLVYNVDALNALQASSISPDLERKISQAEGVGRTARVGERTFTAMVDGGDTQDASVIGTDDRQLFHPTELSKGRRPSARAEAVGSDADFAVGDKVEIVPAEGGGSVTITVVGVAEDIQLSVTPTLFTDLETFGDAVRAANPDVTEVPPNAIAVAPENGASPESVVAAINASSPDADALTRADAAASSPGVAQVTRSFQVIFLLYGLVVPLVTGLFFLILTLQKAPSLTLLRAVGARKAVLVRSLLTQVVLIVGLGLVIGVALFFPLSQSRVGGLPLGFSSAAVISWSVLLLFLALISAVASLRRVLRIDPIQATRGGGVR